MRMRELQRGGWPSSERSSGCSRQTPQSAQRVRRTGRHLLVADAQADRRDGDRSRSATARARRRSPSLTRRSKPIGYSLDLCEVVVDEIAREVGKDAHRRIPARHAGKPLRSRPLRRDRPRMRVDHEHRRAAQVVGFLADDVRHRHQAPGAPRQQHPVDLRDLAGKTIVLTRGTVQETSIPEDRRAAEARRSSSSSAPITTSRSRRSRRARPTPSRTTTCSSTACWRKPDRAAISASSAIS